MPARKPARGGAPTMWGRAEEQVGNGAQHLFASLNTSAGRALDPLGGMAGSAALERVAARLRAGEWSEPLAALVAQALLLDRAPLPCGEPRPTAVPITAEDA